jgi:hypothetical protein
MRVSLRPLLGALLILLLLGSFIQAPAIADSGAGPLPPNPNDSIPPIESGDPPDDPDEELGLLEMVLIIILPIL